MLYSSGIYDQDEQENIIPTNVITFKLSSIYGP